jgi:hypothetical protein
MSLRPDEHSDFLDIDYWPADKGMPDDAPEMSGCMRFFAGLALGAVLVSAGYFLARFWLG